MSFRGVNCESQLELKQLLEARYFWCYLKGFVLLVSSVFVRQFSSCWTRICEKVQRPLCSLRKVGQRGPSPMLQICAVLDQSNTVILASEELVLCTHHNMTIISSYLITAIAKVNAPKKILCMIPCKTHILGFLQCFSERVLRQAKIKFAQ